MNHQGDVHDTPRGQRRRAPLIIGHRGYRARYPENTLLGFRKAIEAGADGVECDLQKTADGCYVVIHDPSVDRVAGGRGDVAGMSLAELRRLDLGSGETIPLLEDLLQHLPAAAYLDLELKGETLTPGDAGRIARQLDGCRARGNLMISSFDERLLFPFRKMGFTVGYLVGKETAKRGFIGFAGLLIRLRPQYINLPVDIMAKLGSRRSSCLFGILRVLGFSLLFWTVNTKEMAAAVRRHARMIVTDEVEEAINEW
jgi:glycerophosphoryl diester phosphodiesterase